MAPPKRRKKATGGWGTSSPQKQTPIDLPLPSVSNNDMYYKIHSSPLKQQCDSKEDFAAIWSQWDRQGAPLSDDIHILAVKCPLESGWGIGDEHCFTVKMLFDYQRSHSRDIGMVIHLISPDSQNEYPSIATSFSTSTSELPDPTVANVVFDITETNLDSLKQSSKSEEALPIPSKERVAAFCHLLSSYTTIHPDKHIVVYDTSSYNLAGFMLVSYLVEETGFALDAALKLFSEARKPGIFYQPYIRELYIRYEDMDIAQANRMTSLRAPKSPSWVNPDAPADTRFPHMQVKVVHAPHDSRILSILQPLLCGRSVSDILTPCSHRPAALHSLDESVLLTWRTDPTVSTRAILLVIPEGSFLITESVVFLPKLRFKSKSTSVCIVEMVVDRISGLTIPRMLITDLISFGGKDHSNLPYTHRIGVAQSMLVDPLVKQEASTGVKMEPRYRVKNTFPSSQLTVLKDQVVPKLPHANSGVIYFSASGESKGHWCTWTELT